VAAGAVAAPRPGRHVVLPAPGVARALDIARRTPDSRWLDRLIRGQGWIVLIGVALIGIVFLQVSLLKMNSGIGQAVERSTQLERSNATLRAEVSRLSSEPRIQEMATGLGLVMPAAGDVRYLKAGPNDAERAVGTMRAPSEEAAAVTQQASAVTTAVPTTTAAPAATPETAAPAATTQTTTTPVTPEQQAPPVQQAPPPAADATAAAAGGTAAEPGY
jgi:cell division protein FtsL